MRPMLGYIERGTPIHRLTGAAKLIFFLGWSVSAMITYDTRVLAAMFVVGLIIFRTARIRWSDVSFVLLFILAFLLLNNVAIFAFAPEEGVRLYGTRHEWFHIAGRYSVTAEQVFYQANVTLKYFTVIPMALLFLLTTQPSEFAASLSRIGVSYRIAYAVSIAMRYIPDVQQDFQNISFAQQARGMDLSRKEKLGKRVKNFVSILLPLVFSSLERIETISAALELRGFGHKPRRSWYNARPFAAGDYAAVLFVALVAVASVWVTFHDGSRFYNIFASA
ncbi:energy-coupling factor transporter transmembrane protein EcfT [Paenibacillus sp. TRM 82003]|nr:energy-coupling factor transporter transmembrane protein EcfT [Paenibacillus sp. TRM 82003]